MKTHYLRFILVFLTGFTAFCLIADIGILNPQNIDWILQNDDSSWHYWGWQFFRKAPIFQFPAGANPGLGMELSNSIIYTDSIPLFAFIFKPFDPLLPDRFQYFGLWIMCCFILQAFFAWKLLSLFTQDRYLPHAGSLFFLISPFMLTRLNGHYALFGHWVLLAGLYFYFRKDYRILHWNFLILISLLIHPYLFAMVAGIWLADIIQRLLTRYEGPAVLVRGAVLCIITVILVMWISGYFMVSNITHTGGYNMFRMNLNSPVNPYDKITWSVILPDLKPQGIYYEWEGLNFLGIGIIAMLIFSLCRLCFNPGQLLKKRLLPLFILCILLTVFSISNNIAFGQHELLSYDIAPGIDVFAGTFRASGRFFWTVSYLLYAFALYFLFRTKGIRNGFILILMLLVLAVQIIDSNRALCYLSSTWFGKPPPFLSPMRNKDWDAFGHKYTKLSCVPPENHPENWNFLLDYADKHDMRVNFGCFARIDNDKLAQSASEIREHVCQNRLDPDALYIFNDLNLWQTAVDSCRKSDQCCIIDGFHILAPGYPGISETN